MMGVTEASESRKKELKLPLKVLAFVHAATHQGYGLSPSGFSSTATH